MIQRYGTHRNGAKYRQGIRLAFLRALKIRQAYRAARPTLIGEIDRAGIDARLIHGLERLASRGIPATARVGGQHDADLRMCRKIGRASCRERVCQYVSISVVAVSLKTTKKKQNNQHKIRIKTKK